MKIHPNDDVTHQKAISMEAAMRLRKPIDFTLNLTHNHQMTWSEHLWQVLFNVYRAFDCPLDQMHDMLCDYTSIKRWLDNPSQEFYWYFDPGYNFTRFDIRMHHDQDFGMHISTISRGKFNINHLYTISLED